jgi:transposase
MISSMRLDGTTASMSINAATDGDVFEAYVRTALAPALRRGDIVILDNLAAHKRAKVAEVIHACGARIMFLPPYSPDLNPIEKMWSKIKSILRSLKPRTPEELHAAITYAFSQITAEDARSFFESCGHTII